MSVSLHVSSALLPRSLTYLMHADDNKLVSAARSKSSFDANLRAFTSSTSYRVQTRLDGDSVQLHITFTT